MEAYAQMYQRHPPSPLVVPFFEALIIFLFAESNSSPSPSSWLVPIAVYLEAEQG